MHTRLFSFIIISTLLFLPFTSISQALVIEEIEKYIERDIKDVKQDVKKDINDIKGVDKIINMAEVPKDRLKAVEDIISAIEGKAASNSLLCEAANLAFKLILADMNPPKETITVPLWQIGAMSLFFVSECYHSWEHDHDPSVKDNIRMTGPFINGQSFMTHARVRIYYSDDMVDWLKGDRKGEIANNSVMIKEMFFSDPQPSEKSPDPKEINGWAVMVRSNESTKDGWLWYLFYPPWSPTTDKRLFISAQYGLSFCLSCHSSADNDQLTFATKDNIEGKNVLSFTYIEQPPYSTPTSEQDKNMSKNQDRGTHGNFAVGNILSMAPPLGSTYVNQPVVDLFKELFKDNPPSFVKNMPTKSQVKKFALSSNLLTDHVVPSVEGLDEFVASDSCFGCHDASYLQNLRWPNMIVAGDENNQYNLSPYGEWSVSLMGLAGRDPVFHAQLESEQILRPGYKDSISNLCLSCHAVMGKRQYDLDRKKKGEKFKNFTEKMLYAQPGSKDKELAKNAKYGGLARDGVSCTVCHHITPEGLGEPSTFTAKFHVGPPNEVYGPVQDQNITTYPMNQALGITPKYGKQIKDSGLCGSCHTVQPPKIPLKDAQGVVKKPFNDYSHSNEQTTWMEWDNSSFKTDNVTCAGCHMLNGFPPKLQAQGKTGTLPPFEIANIETPDFPDTTHRASSKKITLQPYSEFRRHTLVGLNYFVSDMFSQFSDLMGFNKTDPLVPAPPLATVNAVDRLDLSQEEILWQARNKTAKLDIDSLKKVGGNLEAKVTVTNLGGHKFPTGVGFRRAFLQFSVLGGADGNQILWSSGRTSPAGVLIDQNGDWLPSEFTREPSELQDNYSLITKQNQVQIYENRETNDEGKLTTSFLGLFNDYKDNRILPKGWSVYGPFSEETAPYEKGKQINPQPNEIGKNHLTYQIPLSEVPEAKSVEVGLYYQSIPPYFLRDRFATGGKAAERLYYLVTHLELDENVENWRFKLVSLKKDLP